MDFQTAAVAVPASNLWHKVWRINYFGDKKQAYNVISVPCLVVSEDQVAFGKIFLSQVRLCRKIDGESPKNLQTILAY